jgi:putative transcriptional regulator
MLSENLKRLRKRKGLSQQELAARLHVVRQTVSKWEKGLSVPDADMLIRIADIFEVSVSELLGAKLDNEKDIDLVAEQLSRINEQLAIKNRRAHLVWKTIGVIVALIVAFNIILALLGIIAFCQFKTDGNVSVQSTNNQAVEALQPESAQ